MTSVRHRLLAVLLTLALAGATAPAFAQVPLPKPIETALAGPATMEIPGVGVVEGILSLADAERYSRIFALQEDGHWKQADAMIARLDDPLLLGHVRAQRYLHPTKYRSRYSELRDWLADYADHPQARRIHRLAVLRQPSGAAGPRAPVRFRSIVATDGDDEAGDSTARRASGTSYALYNKMRARARRGWPTGALEVLRSPGVEKRMAPWQADEARREIVRAYYRANKNLEALEIAGEVAANTGSVPLAYWWGGLAAWRLGRIEDAQRMFVLLAESTDASGWAVASGAFWASRAYLVGGRPERVNEMLARGAEYPLTFYGLLSRRALGLDSPIEWTEPSIGTADVGAIAAVPQGARALALLQIGRDADAEPELANLVALHPELRAEVLSFSVRAGLPALSLRLAGYQGRLVQATAAYPLPDWEPDEGFAIDRALVFAFIRQESAFNARARSHAGARGLMQLMPRTASYIGGQRSLHGRGKYKLFDPGLNMALGQRYIAYLAGNPDIGNDLFRLAAAYNAGPGNLRNWERNVDYQDDPLLFIESLPSRETRLFIERILTNFWVYRDRLGQDAPSLEDVVVGTWPGYVAQDELQRSETANAGN